MTTTAPETWEPAAHTRACLNYARTVIRENNDDTRASDQRDGTATELTPDTDAMAAEWIASGITECMCDEPESWQRLWSRG